MRNTIIAALSMMLLALVLTGCSGINTGQKYQQKYYQGYDSLDIKFADNAPPYRWNYDSQSPYNEIPLVVEVRNKGASDAYGALYIQGIDYDMIELAGGKLPGPGTVNPIMNGNEVIGLDIGNIYIGLRGNGNGFSASGYWTAPNGMQYGADAFTQDGKFVGLNVRINDLSRIGAGVGRSVLGIFSTSFGYNGIISLPGHNELNPSEALEVYEFPLAVYRLPASLEEYPQNIMITACYSYATRATASVCIDPRPNDISKRACVARDVKMSGGQGAPVSVTYVEQQPGTSKTVFTIHIHHNRQNALDDVYDYYSLRKCNPNSRERPRNTDLNVVYLGRIMLGSTPLTCTPDTRIRLDESGNGQITCSAVFAPTNDMTAHTAQLSMELWYGYSKNIYRTVTIRRI